MFFPAIQAVKTEQDTRLFAPSMLEMFRFPTFQPLDYDVAFLEIHTHEQRQKDRL